MDGQMAEWVSFLHYLPAASPSVSCLFILTFLGIKKKKKAILRHAACFKPPVGSREIL